MIAWVQEESWPQWVHWQTLGRHTEEEKQWDQAESDPVGLTEARAVS